MSKRSTSRQGNIRTPYRDIMYDSKKEAAYAAELDMRITLGEIASWQRQYRIPLISRSGVRIGTYVCDFLVTFPDGRRELHEVKGHPVATCKCDPCTKWRRNAKWTRADYPELPLIVV